MNKEDINYVPTDYVTITKEEYQDLLDDAETLNKLYIGGVGDWEWYEESLK